MFSWPLKLFEKDANAAFWFFIGSGSSFADTLSAEFNGSDEKITFGDDADEGNGTEVSLSVWVKSSQNSGYAAFVSKVINANQDGYLFHMYDGEPRIAMFGTGSSVFAVNCNSTVADGTWHHIIYTYDGSGGHAGVEFYIDGNTTPCTKEGEFASGGSVTDLANSNNLVFAEQGDGNYKYNGILGDVAKIPWEITTSEVTEIYKGGSGFDFTTYSGWSTMKASARAFWVTWEADDLDAGDQPGVTDLTDNGYTGTAANMDTSTDLISDAP